MATEPEHFDQIEVVTLARGREDLPHSLLFAHLVRRAFGVIEHYHGDLFHDAMWLKENVHGRDARFYWSVRETGTSIGIDPYLVALLGGHEDCLWQIDVHLDERGNWVATFIRMLISEVTP